MASPVRFTQLLLCFELKYGRREARGVSVLIQLQSFLESLLLRPSAWQQGGALSDSTVGQSLDMSKKVY